MSWMNWHFEPSSKILACGYDVVFSLSCWYHQEHTWNGMNLIRSMMSLLNEVLVHTYSGVRKCNRAFGPFHMHHTAVLSLLQVKASRALWTNEGAVKHSLLCRTCLGLCGKAPVVNRFTKWYHLHMCEASVLSTVMERPVLTDAVQRGSYG